MPSYQIHRLKEPQRQQFRWAPHTAGVTIVKQKDYDPGTVVEAATPYALWLALRDGDHPIGPGDLIEVAGQGQSPGGELRILKYIGFEEARWYVPEPAVPAAGEPMEVT